MVSTFDLFNGATHDDDAREKGWIGPDGEHTTAGGAQAIAEALHAAGYRTFPRARVVAILNAGNT